MGVGPTNRAAVQARRKEVSDFCLVQFSVALNKPYSQWSAKTWRRLLSGVTREFKAKCGWPKETPEAVMKKRCSDTARNLRPSAKRVGVSLPAVGKRAGVTKGNHKRLVLHRPNGSSARLHTACTRAAVVGNPNEPSPPHRVMQVSPYLQLLPAIVSVAFPPRRFPGLSHLYQLPLTLWRSCRHL